ncbi:MAG: MG2 domain-containing protein [Prevotella sp.]|nr:MG2 domain-containing protein [Prevotella sp.]
MLRKTIIIFAFAFFAMPIIAQTYSALWKQVDAAEKADLPADEIGVLRQIKDKAAKDREWGHLLKASLTEMAVAAEVEPDVLAESMEQYAAEADAADGALAAVRYATLGYIYKYSFRQLGLDKNTALTLSKEFYAKALANPSLLAKTKAKGFEPLAEAGNTNLIFGGDLLHLIAFEAEDYQAMIDFYTKAGNRAAVCLATLYKLRSERPGYEEPKRSPYLARLDSLINEYQDLDVAGEVAIEHFDVMDTSPDVSSEEKIDFIDRALLRWPAWQRMVILKNARQRITLPSFHVSIPETLAVPDKEIPVYITSLINLQGIAMNVFRVNVTGDESYDPNKAEDYKMLLPLRSEKPVAADSRVYYGLPEFREIRDTLTIAPLPAGVYIVEFSADGSNVPVERAMINITNLRLIDMQLPGDAMRFAVVDAKTGKPVPGAKIDIKFRSWKDKQWQEDETTLTTESDGEVVYTSTLNPYQYRITCGDDRAFPWQRISRSAWTWGSSEKDEAAEKLNIYTDRAVYRPGQTVHAAVIAYTAYNKEHWEVAPGKTLHLKLTDAKGNEIGATDAKTDEWGVAAADFILVATVNTGYFKLAASGEGVSGTFHFRVEEYKRPTFTVDIDDFDKAYKAGDTISVYGTAKTFSGVPVAGAKVAFSVKTSDCSWWRPASENSDATLLNKGETTTDGDGRFLVRVPIAFPSGTKKGKRFARVVLSAAVTSLAGETHSQEAAYPLSDRPGLFALGGFEQQQRREDAKPFTFVYINSAGNELDNEVSYSVDNQAVALVATNKEVALPLENLASGEHLLKAVCAGDTLEEKFTVFSLDDKTPPVDTPAWYFSTTGQVSHYQLVTGKKEYVQFGTSRENQTVFYAVASENKLLESGQLTLSNELVCREIEYKDEWGDGVALRFSWVRDGKLYKYSESLARPVKDCSLDVSFKTFRDKTEPGSDEEWTITVKHADGKPAKAQLMATLYDKALDAIMPHGWSLVHAPYFASPVIRQTAAFDKGESNLYGEQSIRYATVPELAVYHIVYPGYFLENGFNLGVMPVAYSRAAMPMATELAAVSEGVAADEGSLDTGETVAARENLDETAFFLPQITTDRSGEAVIKFTLPESLTTWRFLAIAHDKEMNAGSLQGETVASKPLMVQPNMPRFIREGDRAQIAATVANASEEALTLTARIQLLDRATEEVVYEQALPCRVPAMSNAAVQFDLPATLAADVYACVITVQTGNISDGEQHLLPVLSDCVETESTRAFSQNSSGEITIPLDGLYGENISDETLEVEYTDNPAWMMLDALNEMCVPEAENAISLAAALYANRIAEAINTRIPEGLLAENNFSEKASDAAEKLAALQNADGSFSWFAGMLPSDYATLAAALQLARGRHFGLDMGEGLMLSKSMHYLDKKVAADIEQMKVSESGGKAIPVSDFALNYLYLQAVSNIQLDSLATQNAAYLLPLTKGKSRELSVFGKAAVAVLLAKHPVFTDIDEAQSLLESIRQYSVYDDEKGRYFETRKAKYSWRDYKIPTQTMVIEALQTLAPDDLAAIGEFERWLLQEKRTQQWCSPLSAADAVYAFFNGAGGFKGGKLDETVLTERLVPAKLFVDGKELERDASVEGKGYFSKTLEGRFSQFKATKTTDNISWGAVRVKGIQPVADVASSGEGLTIARELLDADGKPLQTVPATGQKVIVRITVKSARDLDFVEITDNRAACLEPVRQLTGYQSGAFTSTRDDRTIYYFDKFAKGTHIVETEYFTDRAGIYRSGLATVKCAYAPEYQARDKSYVLETK